MYGDASMRAIGAAMIRSLTGGNQRVLDDAQAG